MKPRKERRAQRRRSRATVRDAQTKDLLNVLAAQGEVPSGFFQPRGREVVMFPGADDSVREHEMTHSEQYGPLRALLDLGRVQDKDTRRSMRAITKGMDQEDYDALDKEGFSPLKYMMDDPKEFEAILRSSVNSPEAQGVDFNQGFDSILESLNSMPEEDTNTNIRLLRKAMSEGDLSEEQKDLFLRAIRSNLRS
jgi:DnaJ-domain-containing protein 1